MGGRNRRRTRWCERVSTVQTTAFLLLTSCGGSNFHVRNQTPNALAHLPAAHLDLFPAILRLHDCTLSEHHACRLVKFITSSRVWSILCFSKNEITRIPFFPHLLLVVPRWVQYGVFAGDWTCDATVDIFTGFAIELNFIWNDMRPDIFSESTSRHRWDASYILSVHLFAGKVNFSTATRAPPPITCCILICGESKYNCQIGEYSLTRKLALIPESPRPFKES